MHQAALHGDRMYVTMHGLNHAYMYKSRKSGHPHLKPLTSGWDFVRWDFDRLGFCPLGFCPLGFCPRTAGIRVQLCKCLFAYAHIYAICIGVCVWLSVW